MAACEGSRLQASNAASRSPSPRTFTPVNPPVRSTSQLSFGVRSTVQSKAPSPAPSRSGSSVDSLGRSGIPRGNSYIADILKQIAPIWESIKWDTSKDVVDVYPDNNVAEFDLDDLDVVAVPTSTCSH